MHDSEDFKKDMSEKLKLHGFVDRGDYWSGPCPVHRGDNKTACTIYKDTKIWRCWTKECHKDQSALWDALKIDKQIIYTNQQLDKEEISIDNLPELMSKRELKKRFCTPSPFLMNRGFSKEILEEFCIGACFNAKDFLLNRTVVPMFYEGRMIGWSARSHNSQSPTKWIHSKGLPKSKYLYNMDAIENTVILTEGPLDCLRVIEAGYKSCAAILGSSLTDFQIEILRRKQVSKVVLLFDNDEAGQAATTKAIEKLTDFKVIVPKISGDDPGDMTSDQLSNELKEFINE